MRVLLSLVRVSTFTLWESQAPRCPYLPPACERGRRNDVSAPTGSRDTGATRAPYRGRFHSTRRPPMTCLHRAALAALFSLPLAALAQPADGAPPPGGAPHGPPPEAIAACKGKAVGTSASFTDRG